MKDYSESIETCPLADVQKIIHGKWTMVIIYLLSRETLRFSELKRKLPHVTEANLTKELRALEQFGLVHREVYREVPPACRIFSDTDRYTLSSGPGSAGRMGTGIPGPEQ